MKKIYTILLCLTLIPMLFAKPFKNAVSDKSYDPDSRINPHPSTEPVHVDDGRALGDILLTIDLTAIGMPGDGYDNAGLTWDGTYLYLVNMYDNHIYKIDPVTPSIVDNWAVPSTLCWGLGNEQNLWVTEVLSDSHLAYEYTYEGTPTGNSFYCLQGGASWMGDASENWQDGEIWILAVGGSNKAYKFSVPGGVCIDSIGDPVWTYTSQRGLTYDSWEEKFWVGGWNSDTVWWIYNDGTPTGIQFSFNNVASLAYDWQSFPYGHVLWIATNEAVNQIHMVDIGYIPPPTWDFEYGWQEWTHTNGLAFPAAWGREASDYQGASWQIPESGDTSMWIDSDAAGSGTWVQDTALSPVLVPFYIDRLTYGVSLNMLTGGTEWLEVGIKYYDGTSWTVIPLKTYTTDTGPMWDSVNISAYNGYQFIQIYFYYDDNNTWAQFAAFDNVLLVGLTAEHDVGCASVISPPEGDLIPAADYDVIGQICNYGHYVETFDVAANVYDTLSWNLIFTQTMTMTDFPFGTDSNVTFGVVTFEDDKVYYTEIYTEFVDENPGNDTSAIYSNTTTYDYHWDFETGWQGWTHTNGLSFPAAWDVISSNYHPYWTPPDPGDSCMWIDSDANGSGSILTEDTALSPVIAPLPTTLDLMYGVSYNWISSGEWLEVGIKYYDGASWTVVPLMVYTGDVAPTWETIDISAFNTYDSLQIYFFYTDNYIWAWYAVFDNVMINGDTTGIIEETKDDITLKFGFAPDMPTVTKHPTIVYTTTIPGKVCLKIYDSTGRLIKTLVNHQNEPAGAKTVFWDGKDENLRNVANGIYFLKLDAQEKSATHKLIYIR